MAGNVLEEWVERRVQERYQQLTERVNLLDAQLTQSQQGGQHAISSSPTPPYPQGTQGPQGSQGSQREGGGVLGWVWGLLYGTPVVTPPDESDVQSRIVFLKGVETKLQLLSDENIKIKQELLQCRNTTPPSVYSQDIIELNKRIADLEKKLIPVARAVLSKTLIDPNDVFTLADIEYFQQTDPKNSELWGNLLGKNSEYIEKLGALYKQNEENDRLLNEKCLKLARVAIIYQFAAPKDIIDPDTTANYSIFVENILTFYNDVKAGNMRNSKYFRFPSAMMLFTRAMAWVFESDFEALAKIYTDDYFEKYVLLNIESLPKFLQRAIIANWGKPVLAEHDKRKQLMINLRTDYIVRFYAASGQKKEDRNIFILKPPSDLLQKKDLHNIHVRALYVLLVSQNETEMDEILNEPETNLYLNKIDRDIAEGARIKYQTRLDTREQIRKAAERDEQEKANFRSKATSPIKSTAATIFTQATPVSQPIIIPTGTVQNLARDLLKITPDLGTKRP